MESFNKRKLDDLPALQTRTNSEIVALALKIYADNFVMLFIFALVTGLVSALVLLPFQLEYQRKLINLFAAPALGDQITLLTAQAVVSYLQAAIFTALVTFITSEALFNRRLSVGVALRESLPGMRCFAVGLLLYMGLLFVALVIIGVASALLPFFAFFYGVVIYGGLVLYYFLAPVYTLENPTTSQGLSRAWMLGKERFWSNFALLVGLTLVITAAIVLTSTLIDSFTNGQVTLANWEGYYTTTYIIGAIIGAIAAPLLPITMTIKYFDTRVRVEGLDISLAAVPHESPRLSDIAPAVPPRPIMQNRDWRNVLLITAVFFGFMFVVVMSVGLPPLP